MGIKNFFKKLTFFVDFLFYSAYNNASTCKSRVLANFKKGFKMELSERKIKILNIAVEEFIKDSAPITSSSVKDNASLDCSTATLRQELNALEAMGFLKQLHTSGGRVPTAQG